MWMIPSPLENVFDFEDRQNYKKKVDQMGAVSEDFQRFSFT